MSRIDQTHRTLFSVLAQVDEVLSDLFVDPTADLSDEENASLMELRRHVKAKIAGLPARKSADILRKVLAVTDNGDEALSSSKAGRLVLAQMQDTVKSTNAR